MYTNRDRYSAGSLLRTTVMAANSTPALELEEQWPANRDVITVFRQPVIEVGKLGPLPPAETDCVAETAVQQTDHALPVLPVPVQNFPVPLEKTPVLFSRQFAVNPLNSLLNGSAAGIRDPSITAQQPILFINEARHE